MTEENSRQLLPLERDRITSLLGPVGLELASLTAAIAISVHTGREVITGWVPDQPGPVVLIAYEGDWVDWKSLIVDISAVIGADVPMLDLRFPHERMVEVAQKPDGRSPDREAYWAPYREADDAAARTAGRNPENRLFIVFGLERAIGFGSDGALLELYRYFDGITTLFVGMHHPLHEGNQLNGDLWAGDFGPIATLADLGERMDGVRDFLSRLAEFRVQRTRGRARVHQRRRRPSGKRRAVQGGKSAYDRTAARADAFFAVEPLEVLRTILDNGRSEASQRIKAKARSQGIAPGHLWHAAKRLEAALAQPDDAAGVLHGYAARFDQWVEVDRWPEGHFLQRFARGCFRKTIAESANRMRVNFQHGRGQQLGDKALGATAELELLEDDRGLRYEVPLDATEENQRLAKALRAGLYGSSVSFSAVAEDFVVRPRRSAYNPKGLPELTVLEARLPDFGPVASPVDPTTTAGIRVAD